MVLYGRSGNSDDLNQNFSLGKFQVLEGFEIWEITTYLNYITLDE